jgi:hypothetical protein
MSTCETRSDHLVDEFVRYLNASGFEAKFPDDVPEELRTSEAEYGTFRWQIRRATSNPWIEQLVQRLPHVLPRPFRFMIERYRYCHFKVGPLMLFANSGHGLFYEFSSRVFMDKHLVPTLHQHGYLQFGLPQGGNYDPICFDTQRQARDDAPIVQLDHEEILIRSRIRVVEEIAPTFAAFMLRAIVEKFPVG